MKTILSVILKYVFFYLISHRQVKTKYKELNIYIYVYIKYDGYFFTVINKYFNKVLNNLNCLYPLIKFSDELTFLDVYNK